MALTTWLIDKSAYVRLTRSPDREVWAERIQRGLVYLSSVTMLEIGYSFRDSAEGRRELGSAPLIALNLVYSHPHVEKRAHEVQMALLEKSQHRGVAIPDLLVAAAAETSGHTVLHLDRDFELIADYTGQPLERLAVDTDPPRATDTA